MNLVQKELESEENKTYHLFRIINVEVAEIDAFWQPKEELNSVTIKGIRDIPFLHSNMGYELRKDLAENAHLLLFTRVAEPMQSSFHTI